MLKLIKKSNDNANTEQKERYCNSLLQQMKQFALVNLPIEMK